MIDQLKKAASTAADDEKALTEKYGGQCILSIEVQTDGIEVRGVFWPADATDRIGAAVRVSWLEFDHGHVDVLQMALTRVRDLMWQKTDEVLL